MGKKKKRNYPDVEELLNRPWCYYCERDFEDLKLLVSHQKAKHFKCDRCGKRLGTAGGLSVHMNQVHKEQLKIIENALPTRGSPDIEIFGMVGIPEDIVAQHNQRIIQQFYQNQADRQAATGNPPRGGGTGQPRKKIKIETPEELKKRFAEHRAKMQAIKAGLAPPNGTSAEGGQGSGRVNVPGTFDPSGLHANAAAPGAMPYGEPPQGVFGAPPPAAFGPPGLPARPPGVPAAWPPPHPPYSVPAMPGPGASTVDELIAGAAAAAGLGQAPAGDDIDRVIRMAEAGIRVPPPGQASVAGGRGAPAEEGATGPPEAEDDEAGGAAGGKKKKDKSGRMVYADSDVSPEEKLAEMPRYRWVEA